MVKYALVLGGGGAKCSYQIGVWKALKEIGVKFDSIIGTSAGALNAALIIQNDLKSAIKLWKHISLDNIISIPVEFIKNGKLYVDINNVFHIPKLQQAFFKSGGFDTTPLKELLTKYISEEKIRKSNIELGIVTYNVNKLKSIKMFLGDIPKNKLITYLLASASLPGFKSVKIENDIFIDGGMYDNLPYDIMKRRGYKNIILVDVSGLGLNRKPNIINTNTIYIKNSINIGNILEFTPEFIKKFMLLGYLDTQRVFNRIKGINYFYNVKKNEIDTLESLLYKKEVFLLYKKYFKKEVLFNRKNINESIQTALPSKIRDYQHITIALVENTAQYLNIEKIKLYDFKNFLKLIYEKYEFKKGNKFVAHNIFYVLLKHYFGG